MTVWTPPGPPAEIFPADQWRRIDEILQQLEPVQALWLSGYLAASATRAEPRSSPSSGAAAAPELTIAYGSETGNGEQLAQSLYQAARSAGHAARLVDLATLKVRQLRKLSTLWLITSTHGDGDPPLGAVDFHRDLFAAENMDLSGLHYAVLALGDSSYEHFCQTGIDFDERLAAMGATRLAERVDCDVDFDTAAAQWSSERLAALPAVDSSENVAAPVFTPSAEAASQYSKQRPLHTEVLEQLPLSAAGRSRGNYHVTLALEEGSLTLEPGDAVGVFAKNPPALVEAVLNATGLDAETPVRVGEQSLSLVEALSCERDLAIPGKKLAQQWAQWSGDPALGTLVEDNKLLRGWLKQQHVLDLLHGYPANVPEAQALVDALRPLQPRLYDVANHIDAGSDELDLLVKRFDYRLGETDHQGIASYYLCDLAPGDPVCIYPHRNPRFALSQCEEPVILVGYGTGLAPYRAYLQARMARDDSNPCWLVMGEKNYEQDFLYQIEWQAWLASGTLSHLDPVFTDDNRSRQMGTVFVEQAVRLTQWLADGAVIYLCGEKETLTRCEEQLQHAYGDANGLTPEDSAEFWKTLAADGRIKRNLY